MLHIREKHIEKLASFSSTRKRSVLEKLLKLLNLIGLWEALSLGKILFKIFYKKDLEISGNVTEEIFFWEDK